MPEQKSCRYGPEQSFGKHVDDSVEMADGSYTEYTLLIYLSGTGMPATKAKQKPAAKGSATLIGGETIFYGKPEKTQIPCTSTL